jgi:hypothetical protein
VSVDRTVNGELSYPPVRARWPAQALSARQRFLPAIPLSNATIAAASGFVAGAVTLATLRAARTRRRLRKGRKRGRRDLQTRSVLATRSVLVDVHLLER